MFMALFLLNCVHPGFVLRGPDSELPRLSRKEKKALKRELKEAKKAAKEERTTIKAGQRGQFLSENVSEHYEMESDDGASHYNAGLSEGVGPYDMEMGTSETAYTGPGWRRSDGRGGYVHPEWRQEQIQQDSARVLLFARYPADGALGRSEMG